MKVAVIPCSKEKIWDDGGWRGPAEASAAYTSPLHRAARSYGDAWADEVLILSAKYGLLRLSDTLPGPYDVTFSRPDDPVISSAELGRQAARLRDASELLIACPDDYSERLLAAIGPTQAKIHQPLLGTPLSDLAQMTAILLSLSQPPTT